MTIEEKISENDILREVNQLLTTSYQKETLANQTAKGIVKYPNTVNINDYSIIGWIDHNVQELIDSSVYYKALILKIKSKSDLFADEFVLVTLENELLGNISKLNKLEVLRNYYLEGEHHAPNRSDH